MLEALQNLFYLTVQKMDWLGRKIPLLWAMKEEKVLVKVSLSV